MGKNRAGETYLRVVITGDSGVGKTSICDQFIQGIFVTDYDPANEDSFRKVVEVDNERYIVELLDVTVSLDRQLSSPVDAFLVVFSIFDRSSFDRAVQDMETIVSVMTSKFKHVPPIVLVCNKSDLEAERDVRECDARDCAREFHAKYVECSAKTGHNVNQMIWDVVRSIRQHRAKLAEANDGTKKENRNCRLM